MVLLRTVDDLKTLPPPWPEDLLPKIRRDIHEAGKKLIILDDDPTGTQTVRDLPVITDWSVEVLTAELQGPFSAFFILTNSRSLPENKASLLAREIGANLLQAADNAGVEFLVVSRSDSTLRGHFPIEVDAMAGVLGKERLPYLLAPFFLEGGRYTVGDVHYVQDGENLVPAADTIFARDAAFGFHSSDLKSWVADKTLGKISANSVVSVTIKDIRAGGPLVVQQLLQAVPAGGACIINATCYRDMEVVVAALLEAERNGCEFLLRTAASFVRIRTGMAVETKLLTGAELCSGSGVGGMFVIGSYVEKTGRQLRALLDQHEIVGVELAVPDLLEGARSTRAIAEAAAAVNKILAAGRTCALYTSRNLVRGEDGGASLAIGGKVSDALVAVVRQVEYQPGFLVAKGGITSSDIATRALLVQRAMVLGQPLPGVPAWKLGPESRYPGMAYIVFPGNVGSDLALVDLHNLLLGQQTGG